MPTTTALATDLLVSDAFRIDPDLPSSAVLSSWSDVFDDLREGRPPLGVVSLPNGGSSAAAVNASATDVQATRRLRLAGKLG
jgi:hypothetical protein